MPLFSKCDGQVPEPCLLKIYLHLWRQNSIRQEQEKWEWDEKLFLLIASWCHHCVTKSYEAEMNMQQFHELKLDQIASCLSLSYS